MKMSDGFAKIFVKNAIKYGVLAFAVKKSDVIFRYPQPPHSLS